MKFSVLIFCGFFSVSHALGSVIDAKVERRNPARLMCDVSSDEGSRLFIWKVESYGIEPHDAQWKNMALHVEARNYKVFSVQLKDARFRQTVFANHPFSINEQYESDSLTASVSDEEGDKFFRTTCYVTKEK